MTLSAPTSALPSEPFEDDRSTAEPPTIPLTPGAQGRPKSGRRRAVSQERLASLVQGRKAVLCVDNVSVSFDGFKALNELTLILDTGELRCIIGPNGAGKTTLMDCITGKTRPDTGSVYLVGHGEDLIGLSEHAIAELGICRKFQRPTVFGGHSVFENLELALAGNRGLWRSLFGGLSKAEAEVIDQTLETIGLKDARERPAGQLSHGQKQWLEIGMLLAQKPRVLLVDEPIAGMTHAETERTAELLVSLAGERTVVVVEHDMEFVRNIASRVTVLHEGRVLAEGSLDQVQANPEVVEVYLGESLA
jgi:urea transport system ATP-binding protein